MCGKKLIDIYNFLCFLLQSINIWKKKQSFCEEFFLAAQTKWFMAFLWDFSLEFGWKIVLAALWFVECLEKHVKIVKFLHHSIVHVENVSTKLCRAIFRVNSKRRKPVDSWMRVLWNFATHFWLLLLINLSSTCI